VVFPRCVSRGKDVAQSYRISPPDTDMLYRSLCLEDSSDLWDKGHCKQGKRVRNCSRRLLDIVKQQYLPNRSHSPGGQWIMVPFWQ
jgi:hypothetical protein